LRAADPPRISAMSVATAAPRASAADQLLVTELTRQTVLYLLAHPGACNVEVARAVGVRHESQMSRHLVRLERAGIVTRRRAGRANAWRLSERGVDAARVLHDEKRGRESRLPIARGEVAR
jgi:DNA-binding transcriptional ArsR family regulator